MILSVASLSQLTAKEWLKSAFSPSFELFAAETAALLPKKKGGGEKAYSNIQLADSEICGIVSELWVTQMDEWVIVLACWQQ